MYAITKWLLSYLMWSISKNSIATRRLDHDTELAKGVEPPTYWLQVSCAASCATPAYTRHPIYCKMGIEPMLFLYERNVLSTRQFTKLCKFAESALFGREGGSRTHSSRGNRFTVYRASPTAPPPYIYNGGKSLNRTELSGSSDQRTDHVCQLPKWKGFLPPGPQWSRTTAVERIELFTHPIGQPLTLWSNIRESNSWLQHGKLSFYH